MKKFVLVDCLDVYVMNFDFVCFWWSLSWMFFFFVRFGFCLCDEFGDFFNF